MADERDSATRPDLGGRVEQSQATQTFLAHLDYASKLVATWPKWKQNLLGAAAPVTPPANPAQGAGVVQT